MHVKKYSLETDGKFDQHVNNELNTICTVTIRCVE